jgi:hypothetical protein
MTDWIDIYHWTTPRTRPILARLSDGSEEMVEWNPMRQCWQNERKERVIPVSWRNDDE